MLLLSGSPGESMKQALDDLGLNRLLNINHVCARPNLHLKLIQKGGIECLKGNIGQMKEQPTVVYCNSAKKARKVAMYLEKEGP